MMLGHLRQRCRQLLQDGTVQVVIGYGQQQPETPVFPVFITDPNQVDQLTWNDLCHHNLVTYLHRPEIRLLGRPAIIVKACDERALVVLEQESQITLDDIYIIGVICDGVDQPRSVKCQCCTQRVPKYADEVIGAASTVTSEATLASPNDRYSGLESFLQLPANERISYWQHELSRCTRCYACRQVCPLCYCPTCVADKNQPQRIDPAAQLKGNFAWHITRAFHLAGRCVGCDQCTRVCPAGIDLRLLNLSLARAAESRFDYMPGQQRHATPVVGHFLESDHEEFIR
jgi:formate dehydrogenase subunit beta